MEVVDGGRTGSQRTGAVLLIMCCLAPSLTCFSLMQLSKTHAPAEDSGKVRTGTIIFNGAQVKSQPGSSSATGNEDLLQMDVQQIRGIQEQNIANEVAWKRLNTSLHCGLHWMKLKAIGPGAIDLQLDTGSTTSLPLTQVPSSCGYSMQQNALGLVLVVPYDACYVVKENGQYVLPVVWHQTPVKLACPITSTDATLEQQSLMAPFPQTQLRYSRLKRQANYPLSYDSPSSYNSLYSYYLNTLGNNPISSQPAVPDPYQPNGYYPYPNYYKGYPYPYYPIQPNVDPDYVHSHPTYVQYPYYTQGLGDSDAVPNPYYYYPPSQYYYGKKPYYYWPTVAPTTTAPTTTARPCYGSTTTTAKPCYTTTKPPRRCHPGKKCPFVPFANDPFHPVVSMRSHVPDADKYLPRASFDDQKQIHPVSWQHMPWLPQSMSQDLFAWGQQQDKVV